MERQNRHSRLPPQPQLRAVPPSLSSRSASVPETAHDVNAVSGRDRRPLRQPPVPIPKVAMPINIVGERIIIIGGQSSVASRNPSQHRGSSSASSTRSASAPQTVREDNTVPGRDRRSIRQPPVPVPRLKPRVLPMPLGTASDPIVLGIDGPPSVTSLTSRSSLKSRASTTSTDLLGHCVSSQHLKRKADEEDALKFRKLSSEMTTALTCSICMDILHNPISCVPCNHKYCAGCYSEWNAKSSTCPECRQKVNSVLRDHFVGTIIETFFQTSPGARRSASILADLDRKDRVAGKTV